MAVPLLPRVDRLQRRHGALGLPIAVFKRFGEHQGSRLAAVVSYYSFFSVFPLLLVFVTVLGLVLDDRDDLREELLEGAFGQIPVIGSQLAGMEPLQGDVWVLVLGIVTALWAGLGAVDALQHGLDELSDVPMHQRSNFAFKRLRAVAFLVVFGVGLTLSTLLGNMATLFEVGLVATAAGLLATYAVSVGLLLMMWTVLPAQRQPVRALLPGALVGGVGLVVLQLLGSWVVRRFIAGASDTYGTFAVVIALLSWFHLVSRVVLLSAQLNAVLAVRLWPRSVVGVTDPTDADHRAVLLDVQRIRRDPRFGYAMSVGERTGSEDDPLGEEPSPAAQLDTSR